MSQHAHLQSAQSSARRGAKQQMPPQMPPQMQAQMQPQMQNQMQNQMPPATTASLQPPLFPYNPQPEELLLAPQPDPISPTSRKRKAPSMQSMGGLSLPSTGMGDPGGLMDPMDPMGDTMSPITAPKKSRTNTPWTPAEEQRLKTMRDAQSSWGEIAKTFPNRTEGSVKKHWYKDMHYADFAEDESAALLAAIKEYEASKWKVIGQKVGKPAKACEQYAKEHFGGRI